MDYSITSKTNLTSGFYKFDSQKFQIDRSIGAKNIY